VVVRNDLSSLIAEIDRILSLDLSPGDREAIAPSLEKIRRYLVNQRQQSDSSANKTNSSAIQNITQTVLTRIDSKLADWVELLQAEVEQLRQQREFLLSEIQQQKQQHQNLLSEGLEALQQRLSQIQAPTSETSSSLTQQLFELEQSEQLRQRSQNLFVSLDSNFRSVFETLEKDLQGYYHSLSQGLERMHSLGQQGEAKFLAYYQRLTQQLERANKIAPQEASSEAMAPTISSSFQLLPTQELAAVMSELERLNAIEPPTASEEAQAKAEAEAEEVRSIGALTDLIAPVSPPDGGWYLGLDFGTEGLAAVLLSERAEELYPLGWNADTDETLLRLPLNFYRQSAEEMPKIAIENWKERLESDGDRARPVQQVLERFFSSLIGTGASSVQGLSVEGAGLSAEVLHQALNRLDGIVLSCPFAWSDAYRRRWREIALKSGLVRGVEQVFFLEEAIAVVLASISLNPLTPGKTLVIQAGAIATELALVDLVDDYSSLDYHQFDLRSHAYGGNALDQDILLQLLYPQWGDRFNDSVPKLNEKPPTAGEPDLSRRVNLSLRLQSHPIGISFLEAAKLTKTILQQQEEFTAQLGDRVWGVNRQQLFARAIAPYLQTLEREIDLLLAQAETSGREVERVICSGGTTLAVWRFLYPHLTQKFPNATIMPNLDEEMTNFVAIGLACLPLFPQMFQQLRST
jgi:hypothetical protein